ncbi:MAG: putative membrane protein [Paracoccaceae bacterium]|jgi:uncharacterized membrane protein
MVKQDKNDGDRGNAQDRLAKRQKGRFRRHMRGYFLAGVLVTAPIGITFYISWLLIRWVDAQVTPLLPPAYNPETYLPFAIPGLGLVIVFIVLTFIGWSTAGLLGRLWTRLSEHFLRRMPVIRSVYAAVKQIIETILKQQSNAFREVVLFEYPRRGSWAIGFITGQTQGEVQNLTTDDVVNVFLPTTPNPTSGYLLFIPKKELVILEMTVEEGIKMVVSGGIVTPPDRRPAAEQKKKRVAPADGNTKTVPHDPEADKAAE